MKRSSDDIPETKEEYKARVKRETDAQIAKIKKAKMPESWKKQAIKMIMLCSDENDGDDPWEDNE